MGNPSSLAKPTNQLGKRKLASSTTIDKGRLSRKLSLHSGWPTTGSPAPLVRAKCGLHLRIADSKVLCWKAAADFRHG